MKYFVTICIYLSLLSPKLSQAQGNVPQYGFDFAYTNFYFPHTLSINMGYVHSVYADTNFIVSAIFASLSDTILSKLNECTYLSFHQPDGKQISVKKVSFSDMPNNMMSAYRNTKNLAKVGYNRYVLGLTEEYPIPPENLMYRGRPSFYFFDSQGDSLKLTRTPRNDTSAVYTQGITTDKYGNTIACLAEAGALYTYDTTNGADTLVPPPYAYSGIKLIKLNSQGNIVWIKKLPLTYSTFSFWNKPYSITASPDGQRYTIFYANNYRPSVLQTDSSGEVLWNKEIPHTYNYDTSYTFAGNNDLYMVRGCSDTGGHLYYVMLDTKLSYINDTILVTFTTQLNYGKLSATGDTLWSRHFDVPNSEWQYRIDLCNIAAMDNGDIVISCPYTRNGVLYFTALFCSDSAGNFKWGRNVKRYALPTSYFLGPLWITPQQKILTGGQLGYHYLPPNTISDSERLSMNGQAPPWLVMFDSLGRRCEADTVMYDGLPDCDMQPEQLVTTPELIGDLRLKVYPNPANNFINMEIIGRERNHTRVYYSLWDVQGRLFTKGQFTGAYTLDVRSYASGMYLLRIQYANNNVTEKMIIVH